jgi:hypothetical protein
MQTQAQPQFSVAEEAMPGIDASYIDNFMKEIG